MNPLVESIYRKAWKETTHHHATMQKFAELIVLETINCATHIEGIEAIKQHFGIKT
jgi:hypothetical protein